MLLGHQHKISELVLFMLDLEDLKERLELVFFVDHEHFVLGFALVEIDGCIFLSEESKSLDGGFG